MDLQILGTYHFGFSSDLAYGKGVFIVKFANVDDRNVILGHGFSWEERFPLMAKLWFSEFNLTTETFNKIPLWVRLLNLPLHFW